jgi:hypothetical protein
MVGVEVGIDDDVDGRGVDTGALQRSQEVGVQMVEWRHRRAGAVIADARVYQHRQAVDLDHPRLQRNSPAIGTAERRPKLVGELTPRFWRSLREHLHRQTVDL